METFFRATSLSCARVAGAVRAITLTGFISIAILTVTAGCGKEGAPPPAKQRRLPPSAVPLRIVSLAPSITETLFLVGLGDNVVGVTNFCTYPPEAASRTKIGGYLDPNMEAIYALKPDLVIMLSEHEKYIPAMRRLGLRSLVVDHSTVRGIIASVVLVGRACGVEDKALGIVRSMEERMSRLREATRGKTRPRVLVTVGRNATHGGVTDVFAAGRGSFHDDLIQLACGTNVVQNQKGYPMITAEGIMRLNPQIVIDLVGDPDTTGDRIREIRSAWMRFAPIKAVKNGRVHVITGSHTVVPGPRFIDLLEEMACAIHPEVCAQ